MAVKTTQIDGDMSLGRNIAMGGKATIAGSTQIGQDLVVKGWLDAPNIKAANKGVFTSLEALETAYPEPQDGWFAGIGDSTPFTAYTGQDGSWVATGGTIDITTDMTRYTEDIEQLQQDSQEAFAGLDELEVATTLGQDEQGNAVKPSDVMKMNVEEEYVYTLTDKDNHILMGITKDGKTELMGKDVLGNISLALEGALEAIHATMLDEETTITDVQYLNENTEWIKLIQDANGGIIFGIRTDGSVYWSKGVPDVIKEYVTKAIASSGGGGEGGSYVAFTKYALDMAPLCKPLAPMSEYGYIISDSVMSPTNEMVVIDSSNNLISA